MIPDNPEDTDVLFFSAHPDDAEFVAGGTLLLLAKKYKVASVILTKGEAGTFGSTEVRVLEAQAAGKLGGYSVEFLDFKDNFVEDNAEGAHKLAQAIRKYKPKVIFTTYHNQDSSHTDGISHPDHAATGKLVVKAARFAKFKNAKLSGKEHCVSKIIFYMIPRSVPPDFLVDVSGVSDELTKIWHCHETQFKNLAKGKLQDRLITMRKAAGQYTNLELAEGFLVEEPIKISVEELFGF